MDNAYATPRRTMVLGEHPEMTELLRQRHDRGLDLWDEVWEGTYVMVPSAHSRHGMVKHEIVIAYEPAARRAGLRGGDSFNLGEPDDFRVPDAGWHRRSPGTLYVATAAVVLEVLSPDDETFTKLPFYAGHGVEELLIADPVGRTVRCFVLADGDYVEEPSSRLTGLVMADLAAEVRWPAG